MNFNTYKTILKNLPACLLKKRPINGSTEIRITSRCTQRCRQCDIYNRPPRDLDIESFRVIAKKLRDYGAYIGLISGGEPILVNDIEEILLEARKTFTVATTLVTGLYAKSEIIKKIAPICLENNINIQTSLDGLGELGDYIRGAKNFSDTVLGNMTYIAELKASDYPESKSLLYANVVTSNLNIKQIPEILKEIEAVNWKASIGMYHSLTQTTKKDEELRLKPNEDLDKLVELSCNNPNVLNLESFLRGFHRAVRNDFPNFCAYLDAPVLSTRIVIMEDGEVYLCKGDAIGNIFERSLKEIFEGEEYFRRLEEYRKCKGCWTSCYVQRYLVTHPPSIGSLLDNIKKIHRSGEGVK